MKRARRWVFGLAASVATGSCIEAPARLALISAPLRAAPLVPQNSAAFELNGSMTQGGLLRGVVPPRTASLALDGVPVAVASDGAFVIAFDRDAGPSAMLVATLADGGIVSRALSVAPRAWNISRLSTLPKYPVPPADFARIRPAELAAIKAARAASIESEGWRQPFRWPATGRISTLFGSQRVYANGEAGAYHSGIDIAVPEGTPVFAPADGVVMLASDHPFLLEGNLLLVGHGMGVESAFMHLSRILVAAGQTVTRGQVIAYSGRTGRATGPHLHWGLRWRGARIDPLLVAGAMPR
ncbi:M23 family metallopeptidase [Sphingomonas sp.]|jgi:murein DD-endopeptidase MepM/ murein hydrolase activator NlpD|uniref:M23 family metallopeptidase n=1 Tax=Sphingomonas sp. TaxID=28214 RepID=UPI002E344AED|nr:M23 family metallopeptidase [Sphingomonas sp.]HEX4692916.1 M23 family metallopeptidase [Sphingomonas sp.]